MLASGLCESRTVYSTVTIGKTLGIIPVMDKIRDPISEYQESLYEVIVAIYISLLVITEHEDPDFHWSVRLDTFCAAHFGT